jgi:hypothetical protein
VAATDGHRGIAFDSGSLRLATAVFAIMSGVGGYMAAFTPASSNLLFRSPQVTRVLGIAMTLVGLRYLFVHVWMLVKKNPALEFLPDLLVVRAAGPPTRRIRWSEVNSVSGTMNTLSLRYGEDRRVRLNTMILEGPVAMHGSSLADLLNRERARR